MYRFVIGERAPPEVSRRGVVDREFLESQTWRWAAASDPDWSFCRTPKPPFPDQAGLFSPPLNLLGWSLDLGLKSHRSVRNPDVMWGSPRFNLVVVPDMFLSFDRLLIILLFFSIYVTERTWWSKGGLLLLLIACGSVIVLIPIRALYLVTLLKITSFCWFTSWI